METKTVTFGWTTIYANSDTVALEQPLTGWLNCGQFEEARATFELRGASHADVELQISLQFADFPDQASMTVTALGSGYTGTDGITYPDAWDTIATPAASNQLVRVIASAKLADATPGGFQAVRLSGRVDLKTC